MLEAKDLTVKINNKVLFKNLSLSLAQGDFLLIDGKNGSGKSMLCLALAGFLANGDSIRFSGEVLYGGKNIKDMSIKEKCENFSIVFQNPDNQLFSPLVFEELAFGLENLMTAPETIKTEMHSMLARFGLEYLICEHTDRLSLGEKQLVALSAVLLMRPKVLILDEITASVDMAKKKVIRQILAEYKSDGGTAIIVSHLNQDKALCNKRLEL